jgi:transposase-like protein
MIEEPLICPHCKSQDIRGAKPTLEREQDGSYVCATCSYSWMPKPRT